MSEGFLTRWSRRKNEARRTGPGSASQPDRPAGRTQVARPEATAAEPDITPEELAALPKLDELTAETDIVGFLRRGVPEALRNAALRKMWMLDPAIRDFAGHARDYAYDWNTPGGVPGNGALQPDEVAAILRRVFGDGEAERSGQSEVAVRVAPDRPTAAPETDIAREERESPGSDGDPESGPTRGKEPDTTEG